MYYVYLLESERHDEIYVGSTNDLKRRLEEHNSGKEKSTGRYAPWKLVSYEAYRVESDARNREKMLKQHGNAMRNFKLKAKNSFFKKVISGSGPFLGQKRKGIGFTQHYFSAWKNSAGFTLVETLIYIAIIGGVVTAFVTFGINVSGSRNKTYVVQEVQANVRTALDIISQKIRASNGVNVGASTFGSHPGFLSLSMADATLNPTTIGYNTNNGTLEVKEGSASAIAITSDEVRITNLVFTNLTGSSVRENIRVQMTVEYYNPSGAQEFEYEQSVQTAVSLRK
jgi:putative endonuclease